MPTIYPIGIDTSVELPTVVDNFTAVRATSVNTLRDAIIAVEAELGVKPSGVYSTVVARFNALEAAINSIISGGGGSVTFGGDLATRTSTTQTVVGLQTRPISSIAPTTGQILEWNGSSWAPGTGTGAVITQSNWYIDPISGNDSNNGLTSGTALKSWAGLMALWGNNPILSATPFLTINFLNDLPNTDPINLRGLICSEGCNVILQGQVTVVRTGLFNATTPLNQSSNQAWQATDSTMTGTWTTDLNRRIKINSGPRTGTYSWIAKDLGSKQARFSNWTTVPAPTTSGYSISPVTISTDSYQVETLTKIYLDNIESATNPDGGRNQGYNSFWFVDLDLESNESQITIHQEAGTSFLRCKIGCNITNLGSHSNMISNCYVSSFYSLNGILYLFAGLIGRATVASGATAEFSNDTLIQGGSLGLSDNGHAEINSLGIFDSGVDGLFILTDSSVNIIGSGFLYGSNNTNVGVSVASNCNMTFDSGATISLTGLTGDFTLGRNVNGRAWDEVNGTYTASITNTWAHLYASIGSGGFNKNAYNVALKASITCNSDAGTGGSNTFTFSPGGDLSGTNTSQTVVSISGSSPIAITPGNLQWTSGTSSPTINQANNTTASGTAQNLVISAQRATGTTSTGGSLFLTAGDGTSTNGSIRLCVNSGSGATTGIQINPSATGQSLYGVVAGATSVLFRQTDTTTASATGATFTVQAQNATGTIANGGNLVLTSGTGTNLDGNLNLQTGGLTILGLSQTVAGSNSAANGLLTVFCSETLNSSTSDGSTSTKEAELKTSDSSSHTLVSFSLPGTNGFAIVDVEVIAVKAGGAIGGWFKNSLSYLVTSGTVTAGTQRNIDSEFVGGTPTWTVTLTNSGTTAQVNVNSNGDTVTWYCIRQGLKIVPAP